MALILYSWLLDNFDWAATAVMLICGAWNFWFQGPALAGRGFPAEARLAVVSGLVMMAGAVVLLVGLRLVFVFMKV